MAENVNLSFREQRVTVPASGVVEVNFQDTRPNHVYFANNSPYNLYVSISSLVSDSVFDVIIPPYALKMFMRPELLHQIYVANVSTLGSASFVCQSFVAPFDPKNLIQTQEIVGAAASGLLGIVQVQGISDALPTGANTIGAVNVNNDPGLATTPVIYNVTLTDADTEYSQTLPTGCKRYAVSIQDGDYSDNVRLAFETGKVATPTAPYIKFKADQEHYEDGLNLTGKTIYLACSAAGKVAQILAWS